MSHAPVTMPMFIVVHGESLPKVISIQPGQFGYTNTCKTKMRMGSDRRAWFALDKYHMRYRQAQPFSNLFELDYPTTSDPDNTNMVVVDNREDAFDNVRPIANPQ